MYSTVAPPPPPFAVDMAQIVLVEPTRAIVLFGPANPASGFRSGEYYQVTIDPNMASPSGKFIRFGAYKGDEINGWQRIAAITIAELLGVSAETFVLDGYVSVPGASITMNIVE